MPKKQLRELLDKLDLELDTVEKLDDSARKKLQELHEEIQQVLDRTAEKPSEGDEGLLDSLRETRDQLKESHPALTRLIGRIAEALSNMGI